MATITKVFSNRSLGSMQSKYTTVLYSRSKGFHLKSRIRIPPYTPFAHFGDASRIVIEDKLPRAAARYWLSRGEDRTFCSPNTMDIHQLDQIRTSSNLLLKQSSRDTIDVTQSLPAFPLAFLVNEPYQETQQNQELGLRLHHQNSSLVIDDRPDSLYSRYLMSTRVIEPNEELLWFYEDDVHGAPLTRDYAFLRPCQNPRYRLLDHPLTLVVYDPTPQLPESVYPINGKLKVRVRLARRRGKENQTHDYYTFSSVRHSDSSDLPSLTQKDGVSISYQLTRMSTQQQRM